MAYAESFNRSGRFPKPPALIDAAEVERVLRELIRRQSGNDAGNALPGAAIKASPEGWKAGQMAFAVRIARISAQHAARQAQRLTWKHRSIGVMRRLALLIMVTTITAPQIL